MRKIYLKFTLYKMNKSKGFVDGKSKKRKKKFNK